MQHSRRPISGAMIFTVVLGSLSCSPGAEDTPVDETMPQSSNASSGEDGSSASSGQGAAPQDPDGTNLAAAASENASPLVRAYTDAGFCEQSVACGTRPADDCVNGTPTVAEVEAAVASVGWDEQRQQQCADAVTAWDDCALALPCEEFAVLDSAISFDGEWLCVDDDGVLINCPSDVPCVDESDTLLSACDELDDALASGDASASSDTPQTDVGAGVVLLDDGEDGDNTTLANERGLFGYWYTFDDRCDCDNADPAGEISPVPAPHGGGEFTMSNYAEAGMPEAPLVGTQTANEYGVRIRGGGYTLFGAGAGVGLVNDKGSLMPYDLTAQGWSGLTFQMRNGLAPGASQDVEVLISDVYSEPSGGLCRARPAEESPCFAGAGPECSPEGCYDSALVVVTSTSEWQTFTLSFDEFTREGNGRYEPGTAAPLSLDSTRAYQVQFRVPEETLQFDLWIDNVGFVE